MDKKVNLPQVKSATYQTHGASAIVDVHNERGELPKMLAALVLVPTATIGDFFFSVYICWNLPSEDVRTSRWQLFEAKLTTSFSEAGQNFAEGNYTRVLHQFRTRGRIWFVEYLREQRSW